MHDMDACSANHPLSFMFPVKYMHSVTLPSQKRVDLVNDLCDLVDLVLRAGKGVLKHLRDLLRAFLELPLGLLEPRKEPVDDIPQDLLDHRAHDIVELDLQ